MYERTGLEEESLSKALFEAEFLMKTDFAPYMRMGRACLGISQSELAKQCKLSDATIRRVERGGLTAAEPKTIQRIVEFFETRDIRFVRPTNANNDEAAVFFSGSYFE